MALLERVEEGRSTGFSSGGGARGVLSDPIVQCCVLVLAVSVVFSAFPGLDLWFSGLFAADGFPVRGLPAFDAITRLGGLSVPAVLIAIVAAIGWKLIRPERPSVFPASAMLFLLAGLVIESVVTPIVQLAATGRRVPPFDAKVFGGIDAFAPLWQGGGACSTECAAFSVAASWAVWMVAAAVLAPPAWRPAAGRGLACVAVLLVLNTIARGDDYLSGVLLSAGVTALVLAVVYRFAVEQPLPGLAGDRLEADLTRLGGALHNAWRDADWTLIAAKAQSPWRDRLGRLSPLKLATLVLVALPGAWLLWLTAIGELTPLPWVFLIYNSGIWALWLFVATLAVTPARQIFGWSDLIAIRRMLGVAGLAYTVVHLGDYLWLDRFSLGFIVNEFLTRPTVWVATLATAGIFVLGVTSFDEAIRRLGSAAWNRLHLLAYPAIGLAILHFDMSPASLGGAPFLLTAMFFWLMAWRVLQRQRIATDPLVLALLGLVTPLAGFLFEVAWLALYAGVGARKTVGFTFDLTGGLAPTWQMLILGLSTAALAAIFGRKAPVRTRLSLRRPAAGEALAALPVLGRRWGAVVAAPVRDRRGRFSPLKASVFGLLFLPGLWFVWLSETGGLTPQPFGFVIYNTGVWAMWLLLFSLAVTPARHILRWGELIAVRRMVGLAGLAYTLLHVVIYLSLDRTSLTSISMDVQRPTIIIAIASTLALLALALTSFDAAIDRLGSRTWNRIHYLAYPGVGLALLHFDMGPESLGGTPFVITGLYVWVMAWRVLNAAGRGTDPLALLLLALGSAGASFVFEATWIQYVRGFGGTPEQLWDIGLGLAATWQVLLVGLGAAGLAAIFGTRRISRLGRPALQRSMQPG